MDRSDSHFLDMEEYMKYAQEKEVSFGLSKPLGYFSVTEERFYRPNASQLKFLNCPKPEAFPLDLNGRLDSRYRKTFSHFYGEFLDNVLFGISDNRARTMSPHGEGLRVKADIVCQLELLQTLMCTPFKLMDNWLVLATNYRGTLYLCLENPGDQPWTEEQKKRSSMETMLKHQVYSGFNTNNGRTLPEECSEFNYILNCELNDLSIVYSAPINGGEHRLSNKNLTPDNIVNLEFFECKLGRYLRRTDGRLNSDLYSSEEALMWWSEGHLKGVKSFLLALADPCGRVQSLQPISCEKLRRDNQAKWSADFCQQFLSQFLTQIRELMRNVDDYGTIYEFRYVAPMRRIFWNKGSGQRLSFIPEWYRLIVENNE